MGEGKGKDKCKIRDLQINQSYLDKISSLSLTLSYSLGYFLFGMLLANPLWLSRRGRTAGKAQKRNPSRVESRHWKWQFLEYKKKKQKIQKTMQTITKWHWANRRARCWHVTTHNRKENGRNIRKWIEKMSAPCTCAAHAPPLTPLSLSLLIASSKQPRMGTGGTSCWVEQVRSHSLCFCRVWVKVFWVICPHNQCESVVHTHTHRRSRTHTCCSAIVCFVWTRVACAVCSQWFASGSCPTINHGEYPLVPSLNLIKISHPLRWSCAS